MAGGDGELHAEGSTAQIGEVLEASRIGRSVEKHGVGAAKQAHGDASEARLIGTLLPIAIAINPDAVPDGVGIDQPPIHTGVALA